MIKKDDYGLKTLEKQNGFKSGAEFSEALNTEIGALKGAPEIDITHLVEANKDLARAIREGYFTGHVWGKADKNPNSPQRYAGYFRTQVRNRLEIRQRKAANPDNEQPPGLGW